MSRIREATIEQAMRRRLVSMRCLVYKFTAPGNDGVPDRIIIDPHGHVFFVELKAEDGQLSAIQEAQIKRMRDHGASVSVVRGMEEMREFCEILGRVIAEGGDAS